MIKKNIFNFNQIKSNDFIKSVNFLQCQRILAKE